MKIKRPPRSDDQDKINKAIYMLKRMAETFSDIETSLWMSAFVYCLVSMHKNSEVTFKQFKEHINKAFDHYKDFYEEL